jgi:hypothetical protein
VILSRDIRHSGLESQFGINGCYEGGDQSSRPDTGMDMMRSTSIHDTLALMTFIPKMSFPWSVTPYLETDRFRPRLPVRKLISVYQGAGTSASYLYRSVPIGCFYPGNAEVAPFRRRLRRRWPQTSAPAPVTSTSNAAAVTSCVEYFAFGDRCDG